jgi:uncharacterized membrane protein YkvA (DUF1232 family)
VAVPSWKQRAKELKTEVTALCFALSDPRVSRATKLAVLCIIAYALSPIDLIPDFIPVLGYLDDLILIPFGIALVIRTIPPGVLAECTAKARQGTAETKTLGRIGAGIVLAIWIVVAALLIAHISFNWRW